MGILMSALPAKTTVDDVNDLVHMRSTATAIDYKITGLNLKKAMVQNTSIDAWFQSLGVGTSSPARSLHVNSGPINIAGVFQSTDEIVRVSFMDNTTTDDTQVCIGATGNSMVLYTGNSETVRIDSTGKVGINTPTPGVEFEVNGDIGIGRVAGGYTFRESVGGTVRAGIYSEVGNDLRFHTGSDVFAMSIDGSTQYVGIGTSIPDYKLEVNVTGTDYEAITINDESTVSNSVGFYLRSTTEGRFSVGSGAIMTFFNGGATGTERLRITSAGKISTNGETAPDCNAGGFTSHIGTASVFFTAKNSNVTHGISGYETDTFASLEIGSTVNGGSKFIGLSAASTGLTLLACTITPPTTGNAAAMIMNVQKGTTPGSLAAADQAYVWQNNDIAILKLFGNGKLTAGYQDNTSPVTLETVTAATGTSIVYSTEFTIEDAATIVISADAQTTAGTISATMQIKGTDGDFASMNDSTTISGTGATIDYGFCLNPGVYRMAVTSSGVTGTVDVLAQKIGTYGGGDVF